MANTSVKDPIKKDILKQHRFCLLEVNKSCNISIIFALLNLKEEKLPKSAAAVLNDL